jgi:uncharacterized BrkB/YihY/UPF0761 family membrane protein
VACALLLWLWVLHAVVLVGYAFTRALDAEAGRPGDEGSAGSAGSAGG